MKRIFSILLALGLAGCATYSPDGSPQVQALHQQQVDRVNKDRAEYVKANPGSPYKSAILYGLIKLGMSSEDVDAAGYDCTTPETSVLGKVERCRSWTDETSNLDDSIVPVYYVGFDNNDKVVSVSKS